jgi:RNA polymerase sigma factor FliA
VSTLVDYRPEAFPTEPVLDEYKRTGARELRNQLIIRYSPLVKWVAGRVSVGLPQMIEQIDLVSYGIFGLIDAIEKFDRERGVKFETYAVVRIKGAIIDELRNIDWAPRSVRAKARAIQRTYAELEAQLLRMPTDAEVAAELGISEQQLRAQFSQISLAGVLALDETVSTANRDKSPTLGDTLVDLRDGPTTVFERKELKEILAKEINRLGEKEKTVLALYYYEAMTLVQIGKVLGVTESRASQIHTKAVLQLRARMSR